MASVKKRNLCLRMCSRALGVLSDRGLSAFEIALPLTLEFVRDAFCSIYLLLLLRPRSAWKLAAAALSSSAFDTTMLRAQNQNSASSTTVCFLWAPRLPIRPAHSEQNMQKPRFLSHTLSHALTFSHTLAYLEALQVIRGRVASVLALRLRFVSQLSSLSMTSMGCVVLGYSRNLLRRWRSFFNTSRTLLAASCQLPTKTICLRRSSPRQMWETSCLFRMLQGLGGARARAARLTPKVMRKRRDT